MRQKSWIALNAVGNGGGQGKGSANAVSTCDDDVVACAHDVRLGRVVEVRLGQLLVHGEDGAGGHVAVDVG